MTLTLIGYFPKRTSREVAWLQSPGVEEICSVSNHMSQAPKEWINCWQHNALWLFDSPAAAWRVVPWEIQDTFDLYAYQIYPVTFLHGEERPFEIPSLTVQPLDQTFVPLGFDAVNRVLENEFGCSPLSCNRMASEIPVNKHCLIDDPARAIEVAREFSKTEPEPGPYYVMQVWRQKRA